MSNALVKIVREAKRIRRLHPNKHKKWKGYVQEASAKHRSGKIGKHRSAKPKRKKTARRHKAHKKAVARRVGTVATVRRRKRSGGATPHKKRRARPHKVSGTGKRRSSNGGGGISTNKILLLGGLAIGAYLLLKPKTNPVIPAGAPPLVTTTNPVRNSQANEIVAYATAGGLAIDSIIKLIQALNSSPDSDVKGVYDNINSGGGIPQPWIA